MATGNIVINAVNYTIDASGAIVGDKLPTSEKVFANSGFPKNPSVISNSGASTTGNLETNASASRSSSEDGVMIKKYTIKGD